MSEYARPHHRRIESLLHSLDPSFLQDTQCFFAGGTSIVLQLGEYRESRDVDLLCASPEGYRALRSAVSDHSLGAIASGPLKLARDVRADRYGIRTFVDVEGVPIRLEIVREDRIALVGESNNPFPLPLLSRCDLYAEKLLANADRSLDRSTASRDIIDLALMLDGWGPVPEDAWRKARAAYGASVDRAFAGAVGLVSDADHLRRCLGAMAMDPGWIDRIPRVLARALDAASQDQGSTGP